MVAEDLADIYYEIATVVGIDNAIKLHNVFNGQQIIFPKKLYRKEYVYNYIRDHYNGRNVRELSQLFGYSDRRIRQIINAKF
jgi:Mor family transcriptional regulator